MSKEKNQEMPIQEPFELKYNNFKSKLFELVNDAYSAGIPFYLMETIVWQIYNQIQHNAQEEIKQAQQKYNAEIVSKFEAPETPTEENESN